MKTLLTLAPQKDAALTDEENVLSRIKMAKDRTAGLTMAMITVITDQSLHQPDKGVTHHTSHITHRTSHSYTHQLSQYNFTMLSKCCLLCPKCLPILPKVLRSIRGCRCEYCHIHSPLSLSTKSYSPSLFRFVSK